MIDHEARAAFIRKNLEIRSPSFAPGLRYFGAHAGSALSRMADFISDDAPDASPYWAYLWPGGAALVQHLLACTEVVKGRHVLDFGAGGGMVGLAALKAGAARVICMDSDPTALIACRLNAELNGLSVEVSGSASHSDWPDVDLVVAGDVFYDAVIAEAALSRLLPFAQRGATVLVGDILRACLPRERLRQVAEYSVRDVGAAQLQPGYVFTLE